MGMMTGMLDRTNIDLLQGTLGVLILKALSWAPMHGYGIARWVEQITDDELLIEEGSLYPALHRLQARGLVTSEWGISDTNRRVKTYTITEQGRQQLRAEMSRWERFSMAISRALQARRPRTA
jgi:PadR family transcriptional regulator, regulatory protein PadR